MFMYNCAEDIDGEETTLQIKCVNIYQSNKTRQISMNVIENIFKTNIKSRVLSYAQQTQ